MTHFMHRSIISITHLYNAFRIRVKASVTHLYDALQMKEVSIFANTALRSSLLVKSHPNALFFSIQRYSKDLAFHLLVFSIHKPTSVKLTETFRYTHFSSSHPFNTKKGFIKGEPLRLLRTNSVKENFYKHKRDFEQRLCNRGYPARSFIKF